MKVVYVSRLMKAKEVVKACKDFRKQEKMKKAVAGRQTA